MKKRGHDTLVLSATKYLDCRPYLACSRILVSHLKSITTNQIHFLRLRAFKNLLKRTCYFRFNTIQITLKPLIHERRYRGFTITKPGLKKCQREAKLEELPSNFICVPLSERLGEIVDKTLKKIRAREARKGNKEPVLQPRFGFGSRLCK